MLRAKCTLLLMIVLLAAGLPAFAWDETGHKITGYIAWQRMTPDTRERVIKTLLTGAEDSDITVFYSGYGSRSAESRKREYFMLMTTWADIIRDKNMKARFDKYAHSTWHYFDTFWKFEKGKAVIVEKPDEGGQALQKIHEFDAVIRGNAADPEKAVAIAWLEHLIGDIHQPLHTSAKVTDSNPKGDQGGNLFLLTPKGTPRAEQDNLHRLWDSIVVRSLPNSKDQCEADYLDPIAQDLIAKFPYDKMKDKLLPGKYDAWVKESLDIAMTEVYKDVKFFESPSDKYKKKAFDISLQRLALAGYRMGDLFNEAFGASTPVK